ncbi:MAG: hypothetical protein JWN98_1109 [Abditibacteriota bacterium]|nr:hypothetical protein [Abditibacteriota bacterium]
MQPLRPSKLQEIIRQWILLVPLITSLIGAAAVTFRPDEEWIAYLPPIFFIGALLTTISMLHQRSMLTTNLALNDSLHGSNQRLDILHRLALELNQSLDVSQVAQTVLECTRRPLAADAGALWLRLDLLPAGALEPGVLRSLPLKSVGPVSSRRWCCIVSSGFVLPLHRKILEEWDAVLERGDCEGEQHILRIAATPADAPPTDRRDSPLLQNLFSMGDAAASVPIIWEGEIVGAMLVAKWKAPLQHEDVVLLHDIALVAGPALQNSLLYGAATARAEIDGLTSLYNHRVLHERLTQELGRAQRARVTNSSARMSVGIMDLTDFKLFNDTYGHAIGDKVLRFVSDCLRNTFRATDIVGRYGGDEFVVVLPDTSAVGAEVICSRAVKSVSSTPFEAGDGSDITIRLACGVATFPEDGESVAELLEAADGRLYLAKGRGKLMVLSGKDRSPPEPLPDALVSEPLWKTLGVLEALIMAVDSKDHYSRRHCERVWSYAMMVAQELELSRETIQAIHVASLIHDVGKIVVPDAILKKPGRLNPEETKIMQKHTVFGALIVKDVPNLDLVLGGVRNHHERWDGSGYPDQLAGEDIPFMGRLLAVPDAFAAMITDRPYRRAYTIEQAVIEIERGSGLQFDPRIVDAFVRAMHVQTHEQPVLRAPLAVEATEAISVAKAV